MPLTPEERAADEEAIRRLEVQLAEHRARLGIGDPAPIAQHLQQLGERVDALATAVQPVPPQPHYRFQEQGDVAWVQQDSRPYDVDAERQQAEADRDHLLALAAEHAAPPRPPRFVGAHDVPFVDPYGNDMTPQEALEAAQRRGAAAIRQQDQQRRGH